MLYLLKIFNKFYVSFLKGILPSGGVECKAREAPGASGSAAEESVCFGFQPISAKKFLYKKGTFLANAVSKLM